MFKPIRRVLGHLVFIHLLVFLGAFSLLGYLQTGLGAILFGLYFSVAGAICGSFIHLHDALERKMEDLRKK
ncbi:MAG: hypothetical protein K9K93_02105 [Acholeplasmataceae bacterium]|nr:hypothetical protein [Acholeplasmataceae bacterium]